MFTILLRDVNGNCNNDGKDGCVLNKALIQN
jgi:hypothetical protein